MWDTLFSSTTLRDRHRNAPYCDERMAFLSHRLSQRLAIGTVAEDARRLLFAAQHLASRTRKDRSFLVADVRRVCRRWATTSSGKARASQVGFASTVTQWLEYVGRLKRKPVSEGSHGRLVALYADYMQNERGLSPVTIEKRCWWAKTFLGNIGRRSLKRLSIAEIDEAFENMARRGYARSTLNVRARGLQSLLQFTEDRGLCRRGLAAAIHVPRLYAGETIPRGPSWDQVLAAIEHTAGNRTVDLRESAVLMLLAYYALRAREIYKLRLDDLDWEREQISIVHDKEGRTRVYPLVRPVGDAILQYVREVRPRSEHREVFISIRAPFRPLSSCGVWAIVAKRLKSLGVPLPEYGPRAIRHACATHLLNGVGLTMREVGDHLGHRDPDSTQVYAKVDLASLRKIADLDLGGSL